jgi:hypothetical protein
LDGVIGVKDMKELEKMAIEGAKTYAGFEDGHDNWREGFEFGFRKARELAAEIADLNAKRLDGIKYDLEASVYTLTDDEFETTFFVRDCLSADFKTIGEHDA